MPATLASLHVRNLALVEEARLEPPPGFLAITGETGAGKSVLIGALNLILGGRADRSIVRTGAEMCSVEAVFENIHESEIAELLEEAGVDACEEGRLLLRRTIHAAGPGRQFANGCACTLGLLREIGQRLVDLHGPHDHQSLFSRDQQTRLLDSFAKAEPIRSEFAAARANLLALVGEREASLAGEQEALREMDLLTHQTAEIQAAQLRPGEDEELADRHRAAANSERLRELAAGLLEIVAGEEGALAARCAEIVRLTRDIERLDPGAAHLATQARGLAELAADLARDIETFTAGIETDPAALHALEARLDVLNSLKRKYGPTLEQVMAYGEKAAQRLESLKHRAERAGNLEEEIANAQSQTDELAARLGQAREKAARSLEKLVTAGLKDLGLPRCGFHIRLEPQSPPGPLGAELAEFVFAPNPGEEPRPLRSIASSGEISRVMLAIKGALAAQDRIPLLVFDEIDANVGGEIAGKVAARMKDLARGRQVFCITHLPQVAAAASAQVVVTKEYVEGRTLTRLRFCDENAREAEIARMLGGQSATARAHARELLRNGAQPA